MPVIQTRSGELRISFTWLSGSCDGSGFVRGYEQEILLDYGTLAAFVRDSEQEGGPRQISMLAKPYPRRQKPRLDFSSDGARETVRGIAKSPMLRRRLFTALRDSFNWPDSDEIRFYSDFAPHSFFFREFRDGEAGICGGLILHDYGCPQEARYSIHT